MQPDDLLCYCFHVTHRKVMNYARIHRPGVASQLSECGGAGTGCGWCVPFLKKHFEASRSDSAPEFVLSSEEYAARRQTYLEERRAKKSQADSDLSSAQSDDT